MNTIISFDELFSRRVSHIQVKGEGFVAAILNDDLSGRKHQRFILELARHKTVMILNNTDIFPRLSPIEIGDRVEFYGEYVWNRHGGIVHWTHPDPKGIRADGYVKVIADNRGEYGGPIPLGTYRHFKGKLYEVTGFAVHSETLEDMVIYNEVSPASPKRHLSRFSEKNTENPSMKSCYKALCSERKIWVRPLSMWDELVEAEGKSVKRFEYVSENNKIENEDADYR